MYSHFQNISPTLLKKAKDVKILITDCDGVLTDNGVYYTEKGEAMKRFSIRDGMGVERLRNLVEVDTAIMTGETSGPVAKRAEKLKLNHVFLGIKNKKEYLLQWMKESGLESQHIAYIGDDTNDIDVMSIVGITATPADSTPFTAVKADYICKEKGGYGAFREFAEFIIFAKLFDPL